MALQRCANHGKTQVANREKLRKDNAQLQEQTAIDRKVALALFPRRRYEAAQSHSGSSRRQAIVNRNKKYDDLCSRCVERTFENQVGSKAFLGR